ncbi:hypothetical protein [Halobacterium sp. R2-5]|uniref:hypothetical protein n=1 Tax=Halobacterium sp. R2-5 TaxID=2715751 RepID=UPI001421CE26|nr:hypothetical protein [Halobacterium sp. R2-5]NIB98037.1 hypothetical protein [Halobacterium sp. R2-5]
MTEAAVIAGWAVAGAIGVAFLGYMTPKIVLYGGIAATLVYVMSPFVPGADQALVNTHFLPAIERILVGYPWMMMQAFVDSTTYAHLWQNIVGGLTVAVLSIVYLPGYLYGLYYGSVTYPELILFAAII